MKNSKKLIGIAMAAFIVIAAVIIVNTQTAAGETLFFSAGKSLKRVNKAGDAEIVAEYKEHKISASDIKYYRETTGLLSTEPVGSDREIAEILIQKILLLEEAERRGLAATEAEIEEMVGAAKKSYAIPEGKKMLDEYCNGAGISIEEYYELLREQAPETIARQKLVDQIGREYCAEKRIEFTKVNQPAEIGKAVDDYMQNLYAAHKGDIKYF